MHSKSSTWPQYSDLDFRHDLAYILRGRCAIPMQSAFLTPFRSDCQEKPLTMSDGNRPPILMSRFALVNAFAEQFAQKGPRVFERESIRQTSFIGLKDDGAGAGMLMHGYSAAPPTSCIVNEAVFEVSIIPEDSGSGDAVAGHGTCWKSATIETERLFSCKRTIGDCVEDRPRRFGRLKSSCGNIDCCSR